MTKCAKDNCKLALTLYMLQNDSMFESNDDALSRSRHQSQVLCVPVFPVFGDGDYFMRSWCAMTGILVLKSEPNLAEITNAGERLKNY